MNSKTSAEFWDCFDRLPAAIKRLARQKYQIWVADPFHPSLHFKELFQNLWSVRINAQYRALGRRRGDLIVWFWIGTHTEYESIIAR